MEPFDQDNPRHMDATESSFRRRMRAGRDTNNSEHMRARAVVRECLLKDLDDPDDYALDCVTWEEWEDFIAFAKSVQADCEMLTWRIA